MGISNVNGRFGNMSGTVTIDPNDLTKSSVSATIANVPITPFLGASPGASAAMAKFYLGCRPRSMST